MAVTDIVAASGASASEQVPQTICERIYALLELIYRDNDHIPHQDAFMALANPLASAVKSFSVYIVAIGARLLSRDYADALSVGRLLIQHEGMLLAVGNGPPMPAVSLN